MRGSLTLGVDANSGSRQVSASEIGPFDNNSTVELEAGRYRGDVVISANKVVLKGQGIGVSEISGDVSITGNSCTLSGLSISGNVYLSGNNNSLRNTRVSGQVISEGNNNSW